MQVDGFRTMLGKLEDAGVRTLDIMGGEPTLHPDIGSMISDAEAAGRSVNISSNGADLAALERILRTAKRTIVGISVNDQGTLDALSEFTRTHSPVVKSVFSADLGPAMVDDILALGPLRYYLLYRDALSPEELGETVPFDLFYRAVATQYDASRVGTVYCSGFLPDAASHPELAQVRCPAGTTKLGVLPDGAAYPCNLFFGNERFRLGNILSDPFEAIWGHPVLSFFRSFSGNACPRLSCELHSLCHGGCPAHSLLHFGSLSAPDPRCVGRGQF